MNENEIIDVEDVKIEDVMDGMGHPIATVIASLLGGAALGTGGTLLIKELINNDEKKKKIERRYKKLKRDAEKLGIELGDIPEVEIPTDDEIETETGNVKVEVKANSKKNKKKGE